MKEFKGTKGEWKLNRRYSDEHGKILFITIVDEDNKIVAEAKGHEVVNAECMANAKLIATAPELETRLQQSTDMLNSLLVLFGDHMAVTTKFAVSQQIKENDNAINKALGL